MPQFIVSKHVMEDRMDVNNPVRNCRPDKRQALISKAWLSQEPIGDGEIAHERYWQVLRGDAVSYRKLQGLIWVFSIDEHGITLVTVCKPANKVGRERGVTKRKLNRIYKH